MEEGADDGLKKGKNNGNIVASYENEVLIMAQTPEERRAANVRAVKKAQEKTDAIMLRPRKEDGAKIRAAAAAANESVSAYILKAVWARMENNQFVQNTDEQAE